MANKIDKIDKIDNTEEWKGPMFQFEGPPPDHRPPMLFQCVPERNTASVNAGNHNLKIGGIGLGGEWQALLQFYHDSTNGYKWLHKDLLNSSRDENGGIVCSTDFSEEWWNKKCGNISWYKLSASFGQAGEPVEVGSDEWVFVKNGSEERKNGSGEVKNGREERELACAAGAIFLHVFKEDCRPMNNKNVAMLYIVGPQGDNISPHIPQDGPKLGAKQFIAAVETMAKRALLLVKWYNEQSERADPPIEEIRWSLISGGAYRNRKVSKKDVAEATLKGMRASECNIRVTFLYDEDVFQRAQSEYEMKSYEMQACDKRSEGAIPHQYKDAMQSQQMKAYENDMDKTRRGTGPCPHCGKRSRSM